MVRGFLTVVKIGIGIKIEVVIADNDFDIDPDTDCSPTCKDQFLPRSAWTPAVSGATH
jgi:hypothetical protein